MSNSFQCRQCLLVLGGMAALALAFAIGVIIGVFAIPDFDDPNSPSRAYLKDEDKSVSELFMKAVDAKNIEKTLDHLSSKSHRAGTAGGDEVAQFIYDSFVNYGLEKVEFEDYNVLLSYPNDTNPDQVAIVDSTTQQVLTTISNGRSKMLVESEEGRSPNADVRFNAFAKAGQATSAKLVYANYGTEDDFNYLINTAKIDVNGSIVLVRYRQIWRGAKVQFAEKYGAIGVLLFSDPKEETYKNRTAPEFTYPNTIYMPSTAVQRGTIVYRDMGDLLTPLLPSTEYVIRHDLDELYDTHLITTIPVTPISYGEAQRIFEMLGGIVAPDKWQGGLPIKYRLGPTLGNNKSMRLTVTTYPERRRIRNVVGYIRGGIEPDRYVIIGNHHDAWMYGAVDPSSGTAVMLEVVKALASAANSTGWRPRRTIVFIAWDGEEYGLIGSTEFVEQYFRRLQAKTIAYLNVDIGMTGTETIWAKSVPLLKKALFDAAAKVENPNASEIEKGRKTVYDTWHYAKPNKQNPSEAWIDSIGSGSDYRHFLDYAGISSLDFRYTEAVERSYPLYHTLHETMHLVKLMDPTFAYHQAVARMWGEMGRDLADSLLIPFNVADYGNAMAQYIEGLSKFIKDFPAGSYADITYVQKAGRAFLDAAIAFDAKVSALIKKGSYDMTQIRVINDQLMRVERMFILPFGLPGRSYLRHVVFAPSASDVYSGVTFAGITDALIDLGNAQKKPGVSNEEIKRLTTILNDQISWAAQCLYSAVDLLTREI